jgi:hypothetical protein
MNDYERLVLLAAAFGGIGVLLVGFNVARLFRWRA